jgi:hypothetical protein
MHAFRASRTFVSHSISNQQRKQWKLKQKGEHSYLTDERVEQLRDIGFVFTVVNPKSYPAKGTRVMTTNDPAEPTTIRFTRTEEASDDNEDNDDEESESDEDADVENADSSELISSEDAHNSDDDEETESDDSEDEGNRLEEVGKPATIESDALTALATAAAMRAEEGGRRGDLKIIEVASEMPWHRHDNMLMRRSDGDAT